MNANEARGHMITPEIAAAGRLTVYDLFRSQASRAPHAVAVAEGERSITYGALDARVRRLASALHARGISRGDRIAVLYSNKDYSSEWNFHPENKRFQSVDTTRFGVNIVVYALTR